MVINYYEKNYKISKIYIIKVEAYLIIYLNLLFQDIFYEFPSYQAQVQFVMLHLVAILKWDLFKILLYLSYIKKKT